METIKSGEECWVYIDPMHSGIFISINSDTLRVSFAVDDEAVDEFCAALLRARTEFKAMAVKEAA